MSSRVYYNEIDAFCIEWLRNLIGAGRLPEGDIDGRDIREVRPEDLEGYAQCHFFAGIGGWPLALMIAGWPAEREVWTGSCPCQPFSSAGQREGFDDDRHLWPEFRRLIAQRNPATVFGEQVASEDGRIWLASVFGDLESAGYAVAAADLPGSCVGALHQRRRLFYVADASGFGPAEQREDAEKGAAKTFIESPSELRVYRCADGKLRLAPIPESGLSPLAHGLPESVGELRAGIAGMERMADFDGEIISAARRYRRESIRGYGNAIVPQLAAIFVSCLM